MTLFDLRARRDSMKKNARISQLRRPPDDIVRIDSRRQESFLREMKEFCRMFLGTPGNKCFTCGAGDKRGCVDAYGMLQPCLLLRHPETLYDLKTGTLKDALMNFFPQMRSRKAGDPTYLIRCSRCFLKSLCDQCPAKSWMEHGALDSPVDYYCHVAHARARFLGLINQGEKAWEIEDWKTRRDLFLENKTGVGDLESVISG